MEINLLRKLRCSSLINGHRQRNMFSLKLLKLNPFGPVHGLLPEWLKRFQTKLCYSFFTGNGSAISPRCHRWQRSTNCFFFHFVFELFRFEYFNRERKMNWTDKWKKNSINKMATFIKHIHPINRYMTIVKIYIHHRLLRTLAYCILTEL